MFRSRPPILSHYQVLIPITIGLLGFFLVAGVSILNIQNIAWLGGALDPAQHYLGWALYRNGPWTIPLGLNPQFGLEFGNAIVFSDSLPLFAILFKSFNFLLPEVFQYFGIWTLICFILQALFAWKILGLLSDSKAMLFFGTALFVFSPPMLLRVGLWTALVSHFLILGALYLNFRSSQEKRIWYWAILIGSAALIHFYLLAMVLALWTANFLDLFIGQKKISISRVLIEPPIYFAILYLCLWQAGYFSVNIESVTAGGFNTSGYNTFRFNLLAPFDSRGWSYLLRAIPMQIDFGNGFNFFGLGALIGAAFALFAKFIKHARLPSLFAWKHHLFLYACFIAFLLFSITNTISVGSWSYTFAMPDVFLNFASLLRASGRMFWPVFYFLLFVLVAYIVQGYSRRNAILILGFCCLLQVIDTSAGWRPIYKSLKPFASTNPTPLKNPAWDRLGSHYQKLARYPVHNQGNDWQFFADYAAIHKMATNSVYLTRLDQSKLVESDVKINSVLTNGPLDLNTLYVLDLWKNNPRPIYFDPKKDALIKLDGFTVLAPGWRTCKSCAPLDSSLEISRFAPLINLGEQIFFSRDSLGRREFLLDGWAPYGEAWGNWSEGGSATMLLPIPADKPKSLKLQVRAFVHEKHPRQDVEIWINGLLQKKVSLTDFESNQIDIPLPVSVMGREYFKLELKMINPTSPRALGIGEDDRQLGVGAISAVFQ